MKWQNSLPEIFQQCGAHNLAHVTLQVFDLYDIASNKLTIDRRCHLTGPFSKIQSIIIHIFIVHSELPGTLVHLLCLTQRRSN